MKKQIGLMMFILLLVGCETGSSLPSSNSGNKSSISDSTSINNSSSEKKGDSIYPIPNDINNKFTIGDMNNRTKLSTKNYGEMSPYLNLIYGKKIVDVAYSHFYDTEVGEGLEMKTNSSLTVYRGLQTHMFEDNWLKLELNIHIGTMQNNGKKVKKDIPTFTVNAYNDQGKLLRTYYRDNFDMNMQNKDITIYLNGVGVSYLEILNTNLPYKSSQSYNFAVLGITLTGFPYAYED